MSDSNNTPDPNRNKSNFYFQIIILLITFLLGGSAPFWWNSVFTSKQSEKNTQSTSSPDNLNPQTQILPSKEEDTKETPSHQSPKEDPKEEDRVPICPPRIINVEPVPISTTSANTRIVHGDGEIDSDDWTSVEVSYKIEKVNADREILMTVTWFAQERNSDRSPDDTRFISSRTITLYKVDSGCPGTIIEEIQGLELSGNREEYYRGEKHGFTSFPNVGSMREISVQFDGDGSQDERLQALEGKLSGFSIRLSASLPAK